MIPTDGFTHTMTLGYHAGVEEDLVDPQITADEVEQEILFDGWEHLMMDNGDWQPVKRGRLPMLDEEPGS